MSTTIAVTGHRPQKLGGYSEEVYQKLLIFSKILVTTYSEYSFNTGMALGFDTAIAEASLSLGREYNCYIPFEGYEKFWPKNSQDKFSFLLKNANSVKIVSSGGYAKHKLFVRNHILVDNSERLIALWDGSKSGTGECVNYAKSKNVPVVNLWKEWEVYKL